MAKKWCCICSYINLFGVKGNVNLHYYYYFVPYRLVRFNLGGHAFLPPLCL